MSSKVPAVAANAVLVTSGELPVDPVEVKGYDFNNGVDYHELLKTFRTSGFQATNFGLAVEQINEMVRMKDLEELCLTHFTAEQCTSSTWGIRRIDRDVG